MSNTTQREKAELRRQQFSNLLKEMFQLNQPELDFGLYRIMHARKDDITKFIEQDLPAITRKAFEQFASQDKTQLETALQQARKAAQDAGFDPEESPKVQEIEAQLEAGFDLAREEGEVYDALVTFFSRYYSEGDFLSRRVYKDGTYAIPYQGEEVVLHWANKDQYYIKSSETLRDYAFRLNPDAGAGEDPMRVHFKLVDADPGAKDNNKESEDNKRVFILDRSKPFEVFDGEPLEDGSVFKELQIRFFFRAATQDDWSEEAKNSATTAAKNKPPTQDHLRAIAVQLLLSSEEGLPDPWRASLSSPYIKSDGEAADYPLLQGQLNNYTKKNTFDYFIHKDLGGFLTRELDFYIKNELMDWADIAALKNDTSLLAPLLSKIDVIRDLGGKIIAFVAQLENFQKKLWLKKKFVVETQYCVTLDLIKDQSLLLKQVFENPLQKQEWGDLYSLDLKDLEAAVKKVEEDEYSELLAHASFRNLILDTQHFDEAFKGRLLAAIEDLDEKTDGIVLNAENFQALRLLKERYKNGIDFVYADPPYNTDAGPILYKNGYRVSSWNSLMENRLVEVRDLLSKDGVICATIDDYQQKELGFILQQCFGSSNNLGTVTIRNNPSGRPVPQGFAQSHEYALFYGKSNLSKIGTLPRTEKQAARYRHQDDGGAYMWELFRKRGSNSERRDRPSLYYPLIVKNESVRVPKLRWNDDDREWLLLEEPRDAESVVWPVDANGVERTWRGTPENVRKNPASYKAEHKNGDIVVYYKFRPQSDGVLPLTTWFDSKYSATEHGTGYLKKYFQDYNVFSYPKSIYAVEDCIELAVSNRADVPVVLDFFGGSGTTAHAAIERSRAGNRTKFILVEMGDYCDVVVLPRLKKACFAETWSQGIPDIDMGSNEVQQLIKYQRLESYEDVLTNLSVRSVRNHQLLRETEDYGYLLSYMLSVETAQSPSLLSLHEFLEPEEFMLQVRKRGDDIASATKIDLLETFNYLIGLKVEYIAAPIYFEADFRQGELGRWQAEVKRVENGRWWFRTVYGTNPNGQKVLVVWRNMPAVLAEEENGLIKDNAVLDAVLIEKLNIRLTASEDDEVDILYVNGDNNISIPRNRKGEPMEEARLQLIEEAFHELMFAGTDSVH